MTLLAVAVSGLGVVDPDEPALFADDEALLRGRAAFETIRVYGGTPFRLEEHLQRLTRSAQRIGLAEPDNARALVRSALEHAGQPDAVLRIYWTAGREGTHAPTLIVLVSRLPPHLEDLRARGIRLVSLLGVRAEAPWLLGGVKSTSYAVNMAAEAEARRRGADDAVFVGADGIVLEGPVTNVWWRRGQTLYTPALDLGILAGVTRAVLMEEAPRLGYEVGEGSFPLEDLRSADEAFTSSSVREVLPVVEVDGRELARGPVADALQTALRNAALG
jgi:4-amino-4-deoxychorismate lyase